MSTERNTIRRGRKRGAEPRIAQQREFAQRRLRLRHQVGIALLALLTGFGWWGGRLALEAGRFPLRQVQVHGELKNMTGDELRQLLAPWLGRNFFALEIDQLQRALAANPWVAQVDVGRLWPPALKIELLERQVFGRWVTNERAGERELIDHTGHRFRPRGGFTVGDDWPRLGGPEGQEIVVLQAYQRAAAILSPLNVVVVSLRQTERLGWRLTLANGLQVVLSKDDLAEASFVDELQRLVAVYPSLLAPRLAEIEAVDMRYSKGLSVRWTARAA